MRLVHATVTFAACFAFAAVASAQDNPRVSPAAQVRPHKEVVPKPPKIDEVTPAAAPVPAPVDPIEVDQREQKLLDQKLNGICRGC
jgi:hypothetical protein